MTLPEMGRRQTAAATGGNFVKKCYAALALLAALALAGCNDNKGSQPTAVISAPSPEIAASEPAVISGTVLETINTAGYTYIHLDAGTEKIWIASPETTAEPGEKVVASGGMPMSNFRSSTLDRTFETIFFVNDAQVGSAAATRLAMPGMPEGHPPIGAAESEEIDFSGLEKPEGGKTIAEIYAGKNELAGKEVSLRGIVVKANSGIMGKNWLHLQDGTGEAGVDNDLTVTTDDTAALGDTVLVSGTLVTDKDFGSGYKYALLLEEARITVE
jgi:hypothetical protein